MRNIVAVVVLSVGLFQLVWADGFDVDGVSDVVAYEGVDNNLRNIGEGIVSAVFTPGIDDEGLPMGESERFFSSVKTVFFNTELDGMAGKEVTHRWYYQGKVVSEESFVVDSDQFYATSHKKMLPRNIGEWRVEVRQQETLLEEKHFSYLAGT